MTDTPENQDEEAQDGAEIIDLEAMKAVKKLIAVFSRRAQFQDQVTQNFPGLWHEVENEVLKNQIEKYNGYQLDREEKQNKFMRRMIPVSQSLFILIGLTAGISLGGDKLAGKAAYAGPSAMLAGMLILAAAQLYAHQRQKHPALQKVELRLPSDNEIFDRTKKKLRERNEHAVKIGERSHALRTGRLSPVPQEEFIKNVNAAYPGLWPETENEVWQEVTDEQREARDSRHAHSMNRSKLKNKLLYAYMAASYGTSTGAGIMLGQAFQQSAATIANIGSAAVMAAVLVYAFFSLKSVRNSMRSLDAKKDPLSNPKEWDTYIMTAEKVKERLETEYGPKP